MTEKTSAARFVRVSGDTQDEKSQAGDCDTVAERESLEFTLPDFQLHAVSGYKGDKRHRETLDAALAAVRDGRIQALVVAHSSRLSRRDSDEADLFALQVRMAGGRVYSHDEPHYGAGDLMSKFNALMAHDENHKYSKTLSGHINRKFRNEIDAGGFFRGIPPRGYKIEGEKYRKRLVRDPLTAGQVTGIITDASTGDSSVVLARRYGLSDAAVRDIIRNPVYSTGRYELVSHRGCPAGSPCRVRQQRHTRVKSLTCLTVVHRCDPLVDLEVQARAVAALSARYLGNVPFRALRDGKDDYSGALWCGACGEDRMYRSFSGGHQRRDGRVVIKTRRYRCRSCHASVLAGACDVQLGALMARWGEAWYRRVLVPGDDHSAALERVRLELAELGGRGLGDDEEDSERDRLRAGRRRLAALPSRPARVVTEVAGTYSQKWSSLSPAARREWMLAGEFRVVARAGEKRGTVEVERVTEDDGARYDFEATAEELASAQPGEFIGTGA